MQFVPTHQSNIICLLADATADSAPAHGSAAACVIDFDWVEIIKSKQKKFAIFPSLCASFGSSSFSFPSSFPPPLPPIRLPPLLVS